MTTQYLASYRGKFITEMDVKELKEVIEYLDTELAENIGYRTSLDMANHDVKALTNQVKRWRKYWLYSFFCSAVVCFTGVICVFILGRACL